ncbi:MAG: BACON domain-containing protein [Alistipes sp.]|nr:BACON domain-containing protein [Alistipes sp.]
MCRFLWALIATTLLVGCKGEEVTTSHSDFTASPSVIDIVSEGGEITITYHLEKYIGEIMPAAVANVEWISTIDNSRKGEISLRVAPNFDAASREATIELRYIDIDTRPTVVVRQAGQEGEKLRIEVAEAGYSECAVTVTPESDSISYIVMMAEKSYFADMGITDAETLIYADYALFASYATDTTLEEFLTKSGIAMQGTQTKRWQDLSPAKEYVAYAYGIYVSGDDYERVTPIYHTTIEKRLPERIEESFNITITADGPEVTIDVAPQSWEGYYMVQLVEDSEAGYIEQGLPFTTQNEEQVAEAFFYIADHLYFFEEKSAEEIMQQLGHKGQATVHKTLNANHRYMALIYAIDSQDGGVPMVVSQPQVEYFTTGTVERSDMTFEVEFSNIRPRSVDVMITPSTDETYSAVMMYARNLPEGNKQEQLEYVTEKYAPLEISGVYREHIDQLPPETEFVIAVYGYYAGAPTTDLFVYRFTTAADGKGTNKIIGVSFSAFDIEEVAALEPYYTSMMGYADYFLSMDVETLAPAPTLHFELYAKSQYDSYTHEDIRESLLEYAYTSSPDWALCSYGNEYILCGLAEDENGFVGEMYVSEPIRFTEEQTSDARIFVELYKEYVNN